MNLFLLGTKILQHGEKPAAVDLEGRSAGQRLDYEDTVGHFIMSQQRPAVLTQRVGVGPGLGADAQFDCAEGNLTLA